MIEQILAQYGLAGAVVLIFYLLMRNELRHLRRSIDKFDDRLDKLTIAIVKLNERVEGLVRKRR